MCVSWSAGLCLAVLTPSPCVGCVLNACSSYPCHSGPHPGVHRRLPGLAQLEAAEHQEHELRQPSVPQDHRGRRRRDPHRPQRADRTHLPSREWKRQAAVLSSPSCRRHPWPGRSLVLRGAHADQHKMRTEKRFTAGLMRLGLREVCPDVRGDDAAVLNVHAVALMFHTSSFHTSTSTTKRSWCFLFSRHCTPTTRTYVLST